jgi:hypothetical protein
MKRKARDFVQYAEMLNALGSEVRLRIMRALPGDIQRQVDISACKLSHHLEKLKYDDLVKVRRTAPFLWYSVNGGELESSSASFTPSAANEIKSSIQERTSVCQAREEYWSGAADPFGGRATCCGHLRGVVI